MRIYNIYIILNTKYHNINNPNNPNKMADPQNPLYNTFPTKIPNPHPLPPPQADNIPEGTNPTYPPLPEYIIPPTPYTQKLGTPDTYNPTQEKYIYIDPSANDGKPVPIYREAEKPPPFGKPLLAAGVYASPQTEKCGREIPPGTLGIGEFNNFPVPVYDVQPTTMYY